MSESNTGPMPPELEPQYDLSSVMQTAVHVLDTYQSVPTEQTLTGVGHQFEDGFGGFTIVQSSDGEVLEVGMMGPASIGADPDRNQFHQLEIGIMFERQRTDGGERWAVLSGVLSTATEYNTLEVNQQGNMRLVPEDPSREPNTALYAKFCVAFDNRYNSLVR